MHLSSISWLFHLQLCNFYFSILDGNSIFLFLKITCISSYSRSAIPLLLLFAVEVSKTSADPLQSEVDLR